MVAIALWASPALAQMPLCPTPPGPPCPLPSPLPLFPATNWWNLDISAAPVDGNSTNFINYIGANDPVHPDFGGTDDANPPYGIYGMPFVVVNGAQAKKEVDFVEFPDESDGVGIPFYPIPDEAITQGHWIEGGEPGNQDPGGDRHMLIVDVDNNYLYELYHTHHNGTNWEAGSGAFFDMNTNNRRPEGWTSADAAGLAILPGLVRYDEAYGSGPIKHAFRVTVHGTNGHVWPASHTAGSSSGAPPMGARLRLRPGVNVVSADPGVQRIVQAMKTYGLIVADNGSDMYVSGTFDTRWDNDILNPALDQLQADDFQVIQLGYNPNFADLAVTKTDGQTTAAPGQVRTYTIVVSNAGPLAANGATVTDNVPASLTGATWTCAGTGGGTCGAPSGGPNINDTVILPVSGSVTYTLTGTVAMNPGALRNVATVTVPGGMVDPVPGNNTAIDEDVLLCFNETVVVPDGRVTMGTMAASATAWFAATTNVQRVNWYSLEFKNLSGTTSPGTLTLFRGDDGCSLTTTAAPADTSAVDPVGTGGITRISFGTSGFQSFFRARLQNTTGATLNFSFSWSDTTMFSPAWSTNGSFNTFYSFQNTTGSNRVANLELYDTAGALVATVFPITIPAGQTVSVNTASAGVARNRTGTARLTHTGPPGAILAEAAIANFSISPAYVQPVKFQAAREAR